MAGEATITVYSFGYNAEAFLPEMLESLAQQTRLPDQVVFVDDGSATDPGPVLEPFRDRLPITFIRLPRNAGILVARRHAIEASTGDFVLQLDADDTLDPDALRLLSDTLRQEPVDLVTFRLKTMGEAGSPAKDPNTATVTGNAYLRRVLAGNVRGPGVTALGGGGKLLRRSIAAEVVSSTRDDRHFVYGEDLLFSLLALVRVARVTTLPDILYNYRRHEGSAMDTRLGAAREKFLADQVYFHTALLAQIDAMDPTTLSWLPAMDDWIARNLQTKFSLYFKPKACFGADFAECLAELDPKLRPAFRVAATRARETGRLRRRIKSLNADRT